MECNELMAYRCVHLCIYLCIYQCIYPFTIRKNASSQICLDQFSWYLDTGIMIIRWGNSRGVQEFGVKGHLGVIWSRCLNILKTLLRLHGLIDFDETWVKRSLARGSFGMFRKLWSEAVLGSLGVAFDHWVFSLLKTAAKELGLNVSVSHMISAWVNIYPLCSLLFWNLGFRFNKKQWCRVNRFKTQSSSSSCGW